MLIPVYHVCVCVLAGLECNTTWDGWLCWDHTEAGVTTEQGCPDYFNDFDPNGSVALTSASVSTIPLQNMPS